MANSLQNEFDTHRLIYLFGRVDEAKGKTTVHCGLEPPQKNYKDSVEVSPNFLMDAPIKIASFFGMRLVGMAVSHNGTDKLPMPQYLINLAAEHQIKYGEYFTTLIVLPKGSSNTEVVAYQVTDAVVNLKKKGFIIQSKKENCIAFNEDVRVFGKKSRTCDCNLCLCAVRVRNVSSKISSHDFPSPSAQPTIEDVQHYLKDNEYCPNWRKFFDFCFLVFIIMERIVSFHERYTTKL